MQKNENIESQVPTTDIATLKIVEIIPLIIDETEVPGSPISKRLLHNKFKIIANTL